MVLTQQTISSCEKNLTGSQRISLFLSILLDFSRLDKSISISHDKISWTALSSFKIFLYSSSRLLESCSKIFYRQLFWIKSSIWVLRSTVLGYIYALFNSTTKYIYFVTKTYYPTLQFFVVCKTWHEFYIKYNDYTIIFEVIFWCPNKILNKKFQKWIAKCLSENKFGFFF